MLRATRPRPPSAAAGTRRRAPPLLPATTGASAAAAPCLPRRSRDVAARFRQEQRDTADARASSKVEALEPHEQHHGGGLSWRRHFVEADLPDEGQGASGLLQRTKAAMRSSPFALADFALPCVGALASVALNDAHDWPAVGVGIAAGAVARLVQEFALEQKVPFTLRRHTLLLPVFAELLLGQVSFAQVLQQPQYRGKALPDDHPDSRLVQRIADRIIDAVEQGRGGGFQRHINKFDWEVVVLDDPTVNAFVLPGGKIVVFTGIIKLMQRDEDMLATIIGHECAHALARHSSEKLTLGLFIALVAQLLLYGVQRTMRSGQPYYDAPYRQYGGSRGPQQQQQQQRRPDPRLDPRYYNNRYPDPRYGANPYDNPQDNPFCHRRRPYMQSPRGRNIYYVYPDALQGESAAPRGLPPGYGRGGPGDGGGSPVGGLVSIATNLLLQLPFSRRAEAEADLIGMKLMALAGYNPNKAPQTFERMEQYTAKMMGKSAAKASFLQDHPRSANRVKLLEGELELMKEFGREGQEVVLSRLPYWML